MLNELRELIDALLASLKTVTPYIIVYFVWQYSKIYKEDEDRLLFIESCVAQFLAVFLSLIYGVAVFKNFRGVAVVICLSIFILLAVQNRRNNGEIYSFRTLSGAMLYMGIVGWYWMWIAWYAIGYAYHDYCERCADDGKEQWNEYKRKVGYMINLIETFAAAIILKHLMPHSLSGVVYFNTFVIIVFYIILPICNERINEFLIYKVLP